MLLRAKWDAPLLDAEPLELGEAAAAVDAVRNGASGAELRRKRLPELWCVISGDVVARPALVCDAVGRRPIHRKHECGNG